MTNHKKKPSTVLHGLQERIDKIASRYQYEVKRNHNTKFKKKDFEYPHL